MEAIDGLSSETIVRLFYKHKTTDLIIFWDKTQSDYKDHELRAVTWNNFSKSVELPGLCQIIHEVPKMSITVSVHM